MRGVIVGVLTGVFAGVPGGCVGSVRGAGEAPADFALGLSVRGAPGTPLAPAWYMLDADGVLRAGLGVRHEGTPAPVPVRTLRAEERAEVWRLAMALEVERLVSSPARSVPGVGEGVVYLAREGRRRTYVVKDAGADEALGRLGAYLAMLAWAPGPRQPQTAPPAGGTPSTESSDATIGG